MRAINCTQCGATINNVSESSVIIDCDYCGARIMLDARPSTVKPTPSRSPDFELTPPPSDPTRAVFLIGGIALLVPIFIAFVVFLNLPSQTTPAKVYSAPSTPYSYPTPSHWSVPADVPEKPIPVVNYQPRI